MLLFLTILFCIISCTLGVVLYYALKRINNYENLIIQFQQVVEYAKERLKVIDNTGHFEGDDEVGFFFDELKNMQKLLSSLFEPLDGEQNAEKKETTTKTR